MKATPAEVAELRCKVLAILDRLQLCQDAVRAVIEDNPGLSPVQLLNALVKLTEAEGRLQALREVLPTAAMLFCP